MLTKVWKLVSPYQIPAILGGMMFSAVMYVVLQWEFKYTVAAILGFVIIGLALFFFDRLPNLFLYVLIFNIPLAGFEKGLFFHPDVIISTPAFGVGLEEIVLLAAYSYWFFQIFLERSASLPRLNRIDRWALAFLAVHVISLFASASPLFTLFEIFRVTKYFLVYFYISRHIRREHLRAVILLLCFAVVSQSLLGVFQSKTGHLIGLGSTKGSMDSNIDFLSLVPEFARPQGSGTLHTPHCLGVFLGMILMIVLGMTLESTIDSRYRILFAATFMIGVAGVVTTYARGAWLAFAIGFAVLLVLYFPHQRKSGVIGLLLALCMLPIVGFNWDAIRRRVFDAPPEIMEMRWRLNRQAWSLFKQNPILGVGANAYYQANDEYDERQPLSEFKLPPAHNLVLFIGSQTGSLGLITFFGMIFTAMWRCWKVSRRRQPVLRAIAIGLLCGLFLEQVEGITNFTFYTNAMYVWLWFCIAFVVVIEKLSAEARSGEFSTL